MAEEAKAAKVEPDFEALAFATRGLCESLVSDLRTAKRTAALVADQLGALADNNEELAELAGVLYMCHEHMTREVNAAELFLRGRDAVDKAAVTDGATRHGWEGEDK